MKSPKIRCEYVEEMWGPHPGCAEFMDGPEHVYYCPAPATHRGFMSIPYLGRTRFHACRDHASWWDSKAYRFRKIDH